MDAYNNLQELTNKKKLETVYIFSPPRTMSTALHISLTQNSDGQILEPFNVKKRDSFSEGCSHILKRARQLFQQKGRWPIRLVIKDIAKNITFREWQFLKKITRYFVFVVREPTLSLSSLLVRRVNSYDSDDLGYEEILPYLDRLPEKVWHDPSWRKIKKFLIDLEKDDRYRSSISIISNLGLRLNPEEVMKKLSKKFGWLPFNSRLIKNWQKGVGTSIYSPPYKDQDLKTHKERFFKNIWIKEAIWSNRFKPLDKEKDFPKPIQKLPPKMISYCFEEMMPVYIYFLSREFNDSRPPLDKLDKLIAINPIESYVLLKTYQNLSFKGEELRWALTRKTINILRTQMPLILSRLESLLK